MGTRVLADCHHASLPALFIAAAMRVYAGDHAEAIRATTNKEAIYFACTKLSSSPTSSLKGCPQET